MRPALTRALVGCVSIAAVVALSAQAPQAPQPAPPAPPPAFRSGTTLVPLDVRVIDKKGKPVTDLRQGDFTVVEDRVRQDVKLFSLQALTAEPVTDEQPLPRKTGPTTTLEPSRYRVFLIFLGRGDLGGPSDGIGGAIHLVKERLLPQDRVAVMAWNRATDFTTDHARTLALLERFKKQYRKVDRELQLYFASPAFMYGNRTVPANIQQGVDAIFRGDSNAPLRTLNAALEASPEAERLLREKYDLFTAPDSDRVSAAARENLGVSLSEFIDDTAQTMQDQGNLYAGIEYLKHLDGEKHLLWVTEYGLQRQFRDPVEDDRDIGRAAADARVVLDVIRAGGVASTAGVGAAESRAPVRYNAVSALRTMLPAQTSRILADLTGGRSDANRFANASMAADYIEQASRVQYLLGYYPTNNRLDGRFRNVVVTVNRPDVTVLVRRGYYARREAGPIDRRAIATFSRVSAAAADAREVSDIALKAVASSTPATATLNVTVDVSRVRFSAVNGRQTASLQVSAFCLNGKQKPVGDVQRGVELSYTDQRLADVRRSGVVVPLSIPVREAPAVIKLVVYDYASDLTGSLNVKVTPVPAP
ncbi:MAG: VWA domain-containing protein [Acidobacteriota bacterium]